MNPAELKPLGFYRKTTTELEFGAPDDRRQFTATQSEDWNGCAVKITLKGYDEPKIFAAWTREHPGQNWLEKAWDDYKGPLRVKLELLLWITARMDEARETLPPSVPTVARDYLIEPGDYIHSFGVLQPVQRVTATRAITATNSFIRRCAGFWNDLGFTKERKDSHTQHIVFAKTSIDTLIQWQQNQPEPAAEPPQPDAPTEPPAPPPC